MGIGMQIVYLGFAGSGPIEAEAGAQFVRLERFWKIISGCHLAIEALHDKPGHVMYDARLDLITRANELLPVRHCRRRPSTPPSGNSKAQARRVPS
jgi:hypothetical protein